MATGSRCGHTRIQSVSHFSRAATDQADAVSAASVREGTPVPFVVGGWTWEQAYGGTRDQVACVRAAARRVLEGCPVADEVVHLLSELSANAVVHSDSGEPGGRFRVRLMHSPSHCVRGEVEDDGSSWDRNLAASARDWSGLWFVQTLASACGVTKGIGNHLVVWFLVAEGPRHV
jgi:hypothetical protein